MKKIISVFIAIALMFSFSACKKDTETIKDTAPVIENEEKNEFYKKITNSTTRPIAVMIDNDSEAARPQTGLENAYLIYEIMVEGTSTRMMALFLDSEINKVGPVRSSRPYFLDYALENDAIYAHCGYSPQAANDIVNLGVNNINEINSNNGKNYFRDRSKPAPHNLYASLPELLSYAKTIGYRVETNKDRTFAYNKTDKEISGEKAEKITLPYSRDYTVSYEYNAEKGVYDRFINGEKHISESSGEVISAENILVYKLTNYSVDSVGRQNLENIGSGSGYYISNGKIITITWSKTSRGAQTIYKTENGEDLVLNPGNTFVQIVPQSANITIK